MKTVLTFVIGIAGMFLLFLIMMGLIAAGTYYLAKGWGAIYRGIHRDDE